MERDRFMEQMLPYLNYFSLTTPCGISLTTFCEDTCVNLASVSKSIKLRAQLVVPGTAHPCHCTAAGKLFLASLSPEGLEGWLQRNPLLPYTTRTIIQPDRLREEIRRTRERGYGIIEEEYADGVSVLAVPVPRGRFAPPAAINFSIESKEFPQIHNGEFIQSVRSMLNEKKVL